jgi:hypothetical protein
MGDDLGKRRQSRDESMMPRTTGPAPAEDRPGEESSLKKGGKDGRLLISIPIIHGEQDMGSLLANLKREYVQRYGAEKWARHVKTVDELWTAITQAINSLNLSYGSVRIYQDGLPECGREAEIVKDVAAQGSRNYQLLLELVHRGARLMGTENPELLVKEYRLHKKALTAAPREGEAATKQRQEQGQRLLAERDRHIAARINSTLLPGEVGLLFLGLAHSVAPLLDPDVLVKRLVPILPGRDEPHG